MPHWAASGREMEFTDWMLLKLVVLAVGAFIAGAMGWIK
jgi:hypothetical protein